ncbi:MAG: hypothetical protein QOE47_2607 [Pyrinomonadaceae bacterium]|jgi:hypothetical protein|nr:hypothetical protein [Pyrinomonadaceae bacterium]
MQGVGKADRVKLVIFLLFVAVLGLTLLAGWSRSSAQQAGGAEQLARANANDKSTSEAKSNSAAALLAPARTHNNSASPVSQQAAAAEATEGCATCHNNIEPMHVTSNGKMEAGGKDGVGLTCTKCHGGNPVGKTSEEAHVRPRNPNFWKVGGKSSSANPERTNALLNRESWEFVRFINPADLRVAQKTCGECHTAEVEANDNSMMRHGAMLWGAALYNNGGFPLKDARFGEAYTEETGAPMRLIQVPLPTREQQLLKGWLPLIDPLPRWEISQPGNLLRVFERGGRRRLEVGNPDRDEDPGKPDKGLSTRGLGTQQRTDPVYLGIQKTRLLDPTLNHLGTNDHPGDYRSSGCTACHVIYANDRSPVNSGHYSKYGNLGTTDTADTNIPRNEPGHPIKHQFTNAIPTSQCMTCHMHPGTNMVATYTGFTWWDNETDGDKMYPAKQVTPSQDEEQEKFDRNPEGAQVRGLWSMRKWKDRGSPEDFLVKTGEPGGGFGKQLRQTVFADYHGHGWLYRAVFKRDRAGNMLDRANQPVKDVTQQKLAAAVAFKGDDEPGEGQPVHLKDIHLEKGMHCADCHFRQDTHGTGILYNEPRAAIEIGCTDCHGTIRERAKLLTTGPAAGQAIEGGLLVDKDKGRNLRAPRSGNKDISKNLYVRDEAGGKIPLFELAPAAGLKKKRKTADGREEEVTLKAGDIVQNSIVEPGKWWRVKQTIDTIDPNKEWEDKEHTKKGDYNPLSRYAKTIRRDNQTWGDVPAKDEELAHADSSMTCFACHSSWMTSCFGCHLSMKANRKMPNRHNEGDDSRNYTTYNFQVLRDDVFMLAKDGTVTGHRVAPAASRSAVIVSSQNQNREWIYSQQQTISAEGFSGQAFSTHVPHTVRSTETKGCTDCHVSKENDNNAWMAQLLMQGTNFVNFMGRYVYVAAEHSLEVVPVTEREDPQAVIGSTLHKLAYPDNYKKFVEDGRRLETFYEHPGNPEVLQVQMRGEYAYVAAGEGGLRVYDIAQIDHKGFSERITTAPVSRFGQRFWVKTKYATAVAAPSTLALDPLRSRRPENQEQPIHALYGYLYVADKHEGLVLVGAATLLDGDPLNNYLKRALTWNPDGVLDGANNIIIAGTHAYVTTEKSLVIVDINDPLNPKVVKTFALHHPHAVAVQFRYAFVVDEEGFKVIDVTDPADAHLVEGAEVKLSHAHDVYVARTYAYVANGEEGVAIINVTNPEQPKLEQMFNADGQLNDVHQVKVGMTNASLYAYVADGHNGLRILQLTDPETSTTFAGFSPRPEPKLISTFKTLGPAVALSKGLDRDRAVDESGNQLAVFGRRGARPFNLEELRRMYLMGGKLYTVTDEPTTPANAFKAGAAKSDGTPQPDAKTEKGVSANSVPTGMSIFALQGMTTPTKLLGGGLGLLLVGLGWRRLRRMRRDT